MSLFTKDTGDSLLVMSLSDFGIGNTGLIDLVGKYSLLLYSFGRIYKILVLLYIFARIHQ